ncbi:MAG: CoA pyrophosphatase [Alphaproteobacteria bacterium TMED89]|nr:coenzyme A pyrophosphatase [Rhodospirillaceae bacterium]RPH17655.1 MAG: CoA pyrophosphatase [Alphaproteobacteria bacterium TMED89]
MTLNPVHLRTLISAWGHGEAERAPRFGDDLRADGSNPTRQASAVMVILLDTGAGVSLVLTQRAAHLPKHPGQISFPGGRAEPEDRDLQDTARRETREEVGLDIARADVLAALPRYATRTGYDVAPFVALVQPPALWTPQESEVAEIFEVPLDRFLVAENWRRDGARFGGSALRHWWAMDIDGRYLWGATAAMLHGFAERLCADLNRPFQNP